LASTFSAGSSSFFLVLDHLLKWLLTTAYLHGFGLFAYKKLLPTLKIQFTEFTLKTVQDAGLPSRYSVLTKVEKALAAAKGV
jgi:hypothetical protein